MSNPPAVSNRFILFWLGVVCYIVENQWFGWNLTSQSVAESWWDQFVTSLVVFGCIVPKVRLKQEVKK